jgi:hypothetical protein
VNENTLLEQFFDTKVKFNLKSLNVQTMKKLCPKQVRGSFENDFTKVTF